MSKIQISPDVFWVGAVDWNIRFCGAYNTPHGTTYNSYLILDKNITLIDTVKNGFGRDLISRIREIVDPQKIDYVVCQHSEMDHGGAIPDILSVAPNATVVVTEVGRQIINAQFGISCNTRTVKTGDELNIGKRTLRFIEAKMLHWPDNMFTYSTEDKILFSNDVFGQHFASMERFSDEVGRFAMEEATKYFAAIVSVYSNLVQEKIKELEGMGLDIKLIAPSHGAIWRNPKEIIEAYKRWSSGHAGKKVTIVFDTMWHSTEKMAQEIAHGLAHEDIEVRVFNLRNSDWTEIIKEIIESRVILIGSPTLNMGMYPTVGGFLTFLKGIRPPNKKAASFGSYGWGKGAVKAVNAELEGMRFKVLESLEIKYVPHEKELEQCLEYGRRLAKEV